MSMGKCPSARLGGPGLAQDVGPSPRNLGIAQLHLCFFQSPFPILRRGMYHPSPAPVLTVMCCQWSTEVSTKPHQNVRWKQPLKHAAWLFTGKKNGAQISEKPHICISVTAWAFYTLQHKRRQCEGLFPSAPPHSSASASLLWQPSNKGKAKVRRKKPKEKK